MPMRQRRSGGMRVTSWPSNMTRPASGATVPVTMPNSVVLPAPFGPMMPSASPRNSVRSMPSATTTAPKRLEIFSRESRQACDLRCMRRAAESCAHSVIGAGQS